MLKILTKAVLIALLFHGILLAQSTGDAVILMQGKILDKSGKPVSTNIQFENQNGKKLSTKSNSSDGMYQLVLTPGMKYSVSFKDHIEVSGDLIVDLPTVKEYTELSRSFTVSKIEEGMELLRTRVFSSNESMLSGGYVVYFNSLRSFLNTNINISVNLIVHMHDCYFKEKKLKETYLDAKNKKKTRTVKVTVQQQVEELAQRRIAAIKDYFNNNKIPERRINFSIDTKMDTPKVTVSSKKKSKSKSINTEPNPSDSYPNIVINVGRIMKL